ncbi:MAG TPA: tyrosine-type recombinase/integrase [Acidimicrobiales bacterium]|nr:tyrosine-type recombinase/integrase [Acidimicrobiales bacterium]
MAHVQDLWEKTVDGRRVRTRRYGRGNRWQARYLDIDGGEHTRTFARKQDAERFLATVTADLVRGEYVNPDAGRVTFSEFWKRWLDAQTFGETTREATELRLRLHAEPVLGRHELRVLKPSIIQAWVRRLQDDLAPTYVRTVVTNVSAVLNAAVDDGLIARNPCRAGSVKLPKVDPRRIEPWPPEQVAAVIDALPHRYRAVGVVAAGCGLRQGEVFGLRVEDIEFLRHRLRVEQQVKIVGGKVTTGRPKGGKTRAVPLPETAAMELAEHLRRYPAESGQLVFTSREHKPLNRNYFNPHIWRPALLAAGVKPCRANGMHALRHFYASVLIDAGESVKAVAEYLGHADPGFTLRVYAHLFPSSEDRARKAVDQVLDRVRQDRVSPPAYDDRGSRRPR